MKTNLLILESYRNIENLIHFGFSLSNRLQRKLKIVYVFDFHWMKQTYLVANPGVGMANTNISTAEKNAGEEYNVAETKIREIVAEYLKKHSFSYPVEINVSENNRIDLINEELKIDPELLLLLGNRQSYAETSKGLISYPNVIEQVNCPVFIIPEDTRHAVLNNVVYATDYNPEDIRSLVKLSDFLKKSKDTHITILHNENNYDFNEKLKWAGFKELVQSEISDTNIDFTLKTKKDLLGGIEEFSEENDPDLVVMMKEKKGFFEDIFTKDKTNYVLTHFHKPILVYHEK